MSDSSSFKSKSKSGTLVFAFYVCRSNYRVQMKYNCTHLEETVCLAVTFYYFFMPVLKYLSLYFCSIILF